jgi:D-alanine-D-alanine ligase
LTVSASVKIAVVYSSQNARVLRQSGPLARERYDSDTIGRILGGLRCIGHEAVAVEGDRFLADRLEACLGPSFGQGLAFNLAYGVQGRLRYCHVPGVLEMLGIPYVGSGPLGHALASDKPVAKLLFDQRGLPTPEFAVLDSVDYPVHGLDFPLVVKPVAEAVSLGVRFVQDEDELRAAVAEHLEKFGQPSMAECYVAGRELNVSLLGNDPAETLPPVEFFNDTATTEIYTHEDKKRVSARSPRLLCPAAIPPALAARSQAVARAAVQALGCEDWARVDMRVDGAGEPQLLEVNSLPSLSPRGSYLTAARAVGMDLPAVLERLIDVAVERYEAWPSWPVAVAAGELTS